MAATTAVSVEQPRRMSMVIWYCVFEQLTSVDGTSRAILPLLRVCKAWMACALPLLYRHISFRTADNVLDFYVHLVFNEFSHQISRGDWTWTLDIGKDCDPELQEVYLPTILPYFRNLRAFSTSINLNPSEMDPLTRTCKNTLKRLEVGLGVQAALGAVSLGLISRLEALEELCITAVWTVDSPVLSLEHARSFDMPQLRHLKLSSVAVPEFLIFLSRCRFKALTHLDLDLHELVESHLSLLQPFFSQHSPKLLRLELHPPFYEPVAKYSISDAKRLQQLSFPKTVPDPSVVLDLPPSVTNLYFQMDASAESCRRAWHLLDTIDDSSFFIGLKFIHVNLVDQLSFSWSRIDQLEPEFASGLVGRTIRLAKKGIMVLDSEGMGLRVASPGTAI